MASENRMDCIIILDSDDDSEDGEGLELLSSSSSTSCRLSLSPEKIQNKIDDRPTTSISNNISNNVIPLITIKPSLGLKSILCENENIPTAQFETSVDVGNSYHKHQSILPEKAEKEHLNVTDEPQKVIDEPQFITDTLLSPMEKNQNLFEEPLITIKPSLGLKSILCENENIQTAQFETCADVGNSYHKHQSILTEKAEKEHLNVTDQPQKVIDEPQFITDTLLSPMEKNQNLFEEFQKSCKLHIVCDDDMKLLDFMRKRHQDAKTNFLESEDYEYILKNLTHKVNTEPHHVFVHIKDFISELKAYKMPTEKSSKRRSSCDSDVSSSSDAHKYLLKRQRTSSTDTITSNLAPKISKQAEYCAQLGLSPNVAENLDKDPKITRAVVKVKDLNQIPKIDTSPKKCTEKKTHVYNQISSIDVNTVGKRLEFKSLLEVSRTECVKPLETVLTVGDTMNFNTGGTQVIEVVSKPDVSYKTEKVNLTELDPSNQQQTTVTVDKIDARRSSDEVAELVEADHFGVPNVVAGSPNPLNKSNTETDTQHVYKEHSDVAKPGCSKDIQRKQEKKRGSERQIKRLELLLQAIDKKVKKLSEREMTLDDLNSSESAYILEEKLKKRFITVWRKLCEIKDRVESAGRIVDKKFRFKGTRYKEINRYLERFVNKSKEFPDFQDVKKIIAKVNLKYYLNLNTSRMKELAREAFTDIGNALQDRRQKDLVVDFGCHLTDHFCSQDDPGMYDSSLKRKLEQNKREGKVKLDQVMDHFSKKQYADDDGEEEESDEEDEEEAKSDIEPDKELEACLKDDVEALESPSSVTVQEANSSGVDCTRPSETKSVIVIPSTLSEVDVSSIKSYGNATEEDEESCDPSSEDDEESDDDDDDDAQIDVKNIEHAGSDEDIDDENCDGDNGDDLAEKREKFNLKTLEKIESELVVKNGNNPDETPINRNFISVSTSSDKLPTKSGLDYSPTSAMHQSFNFNGNCSSKNHSSQKCDCKRSISVGQNNVIERNFDTANLSVCNSASMSHDSVSREDIIGKKFAPVSDAMSGVQNVERKKSKSPEFSIDNPKVVSPNYLRVIASETVKVDDDCVIVAECTCACNPKNNNSQDDCVIIKTTRLKTLPRKVPCRHCKSCPNRTFNLPAHDPPPYVIVIDPVFDDVVLRTLKKRKKSNSKMCQLSSENKGSEVISDSSEDVSPAKRVKIRCNNENCPVEKSSSRTCLESSIQSSSEASNDATSTIVLSCKESACLTAVPHEQNSVTCSNTSTVKSVSLAVSLNEGTSTSSRTMDENHTKSSRSCLSLSPSRVSDDQCCSVCSKSMASNRAISVNSSVVETQPKRSVIVAASADQSGLSCAQLVQGPCTDSKTHSSTNKNIKVTVGALSSLPEKVRKAESVSHNTLPRIQHCQELCHCLKTVIPENILSASSAKGSSDNSLNWPTENLRQPLCSIPEKMSGHNCSQVYTVGSKVNNDEQPVNPNMMLENSIMSENDSIVTSIEVLPCIPEAVTSNKKPCSNQLAVCQDAASMIKTCSLDSSEWIINDEEPSWNTSRVSTSDGHQSSYSNKTTVDNELSTVKRLPVSQNQKVTENQRVTDSHSSNMIEMNAAAAIGKCNNGQINKCLLTSKIKDTKISHNSNAIDFSSELFVNKLIRKAIPLDNKKLPTPSNSKTLSSVVPLRKDKLHPLISDPLPLVSDSSCDSIDNAPECNMLDSEVMPSFKKSLTIKEKIQGCTTYEVIDVSD